MTWNCTVLNVLCLNLHTVVSPWAIKSFSSKTTTNNIHSWLRYALTSMLIPNRTVWSRWKALMTENLMGPTPKSSHITTPQAGSLALPKQPTCSAQNCHRCNSTTRYYKNRQFLHNFGIFDNFMAILPYWCIGTLKIVFVKIENYIWPNYEMYLSKMSLV